MGRERREHTRVVIGGNAHITSVSGRAAPRERASILNCSRGGALLRLPAPRRRFFRGTDAALEPQDSLTCVLRVPPVYQEIELFAEVVRVDRLDSDPDALQVGVRFFCDVQNGINGNIGVLRRLLGRAGLSADDAPALDYKAAQPRGKVVGADPADETGEVDTATTKRLKRESRRLERAKSRRLTKESRRLDSRLDSRLDKESRRLAKSSRRKSRRAKKLESDGSWELGPLPKHGKRSEQASDVANALKADLFEEESWSNYVGSATAKPTEQPKAEQPEAKQQSRSSGELSRPRPKVRIVDHTPEAVDRNQRVSSRVGRIESAESAVPVVYSSLGGPENGLYVRGSARLDEGQAVVRLPKHFASLIDSDSVTVQVTPRGPCAGLYVARAEARGILVRELADGRSHAPFDYLVLAQRK